MYSEAEMKEFFQNVIDQVASLSTQASRVEGLEQRVNALSNRLQELEAENANLHMQVQDARAAIASVQRESDDYMNALNAERNATQALRETIYQRDNLVNTLQTQFDNEKDSHRITMSERDDARQKVTEVQAEVENFRNLYHNASEEAEHQRQRANGLEVEVNGLKSQLAKIQSVFNPPSIHAVA